MAEDDLATAHALLVAGNKGEAFKYLVRAKAAGGGPARQDAIATAMEQAGQHGSALEMRQAIVGAAPDDVAASLAYLRTRFTVSGGDDAGQKAVETDLDALLARPAGWSAAHLLKAAELYQWMRAPQKQLRAIKRALSMEAGSPDIARQVAHQYCHSGRRWRAWWVLRQLSRRADLPAEVLGELSGLSQRAGCLDLSIRFARRLHAFDPGSLAALVLEAKALLLKRRPREGAALIKARLQEFRALQDGGFWTLQAAPVLSAGGELDAERSLLQHAAAAWPDNQDLAVALQVAQFGAA